jgi:hypothetical protein
MKLPPEAFDFDPTEISEISYVLIETARLLIGDPDKDTSKRMLAMVLASAVIKAGDIDPRIPKVVTMALAGDEEQERNAIDAAIEIALRKARA